MDFIDFSGQISMYNVISKQMTQLIWVGGGGGANSSQVSVLSIVTENGIYIHCTHSVDLTPV